MAVLALQHGALEYTLRQFFTQEEAFNIFVRQILCSLMSYDFCLRALVYSTGILHSLIDELRGEHFVMLDELAAKLLLGFIANGPCVGQQFQDGLNDSEASHRWWAVTQDCVNSAIFDRQKYDEFITRGIDLSDDLPFFHLIGLLLSSEIPTAIANLLYAIGKLVSFGRDELEIGRLFLDGPLSIHGLLSRAEDMNVAIVQERAMFAYAQLYFAVDSDDTVLTREVIDYAFRILAKSDLPEMEEAVMSACWAINNAVVVAPTRADEIGSEEELWELIRAVGAKGSFRQRQVALCVMMTIATRATRYVLDGNDISFIADMIGEVLDCDFLEHVAKHLRFLFEMQEICPSVGRPYVDCFDDVGGFNALAQRIDELGEGNERLAALFNALYDEYNPVDVVLELEGFGFDGNEE
jgi:uncharacterized protein (DUF2164 family)